MGGKLLTKVFNLPEKRISRVFLFMVIRQGLCNHMDEEILCLGNLNWWSIEAVTKQWIKYFFNIIEEDLE